MPDLTIDELVQRALTVGILDQSQLQDLWGRFGTQNVTVDVFTQGVLRHGYLTNYQVERLLNGETTGFFLGDYKILYHIGAGSFARVFRAVHTKTGKVVAAKILRARYSDNSEVVNQFIREAELGIELRHPNIVPIHEVVSKEDLHLHYMIMDFIEGQTLRELIRVRKKIDPKVVIRIATDIAAGLDYAAQKGHQHRDLKLSNVLYSTSGKACLVDFGLAALSEEKASRNGNDNGKNQRSIDYAALEKITGVHRDDPRSDLYFLGCMMYHLLVGFSPLLETKDRNKRMDRNRFYNVRSIQTVSPQLPVSATFIVTKAMSLDPEKRYQSAAAVLKDLEIAASKMDRGDENRIQQNSDTTLLSQSIKKEKPVATVMIVESNLEMQDIFREAFRKIGFRVLVLSDVERALKRLDDFELPADCVLFNAQSLGETAVEGFNRLASERRTENLPAVLLLGENQVRWAAIAKRSKNRIAVGMPIPLKRLLQAVRKLLPQTETQNQQQISTNTTENKAENTSATPDKVSNPNSFGSGTSENAVTNSKTSGIAVPKDVSDVKTSTSNDDLMSQKHTPKNTQNLAGVVSENQAQDESSNQVSSKANSILSKPSSGETPNGPTIPLVSSVLSAEKAPDIKNDKNSLEDSASSLNDKQTPPSTFTPVPVADEAQLSRDYDALLNIAVDNLVQRVSSPEQETPKQVFDHVEFSMDHAGSINRDSSDEDDSDYDYGDYL